MENNTISAATNAAQANAIIDKVMEESAPKVEAVITEPHNNTVNLPGGHILFTGEVIREVQVKELTGRDEEAIAKMSGNLYKMLNTVLLRGIESFGSERIDENLLDNLLTGDRDEILLGIYRATFGNEAIVPGFCDKCQDYKEVSVDLISDIKRKPLIDPVNDRRYEVKSDKHTYSMTLVTGKAQKELSTKDEITFAEIKTILLENTLVAIDGSPVFSKTQIQNLSVKDRKVLSEEIGNRTPGPQFDDIHVTCPDCDTEVVVPISLGVLFQF
jgi:hypothetical protein